PDVLSAPAKTILLLASSDLRAISPPRTRPSAESIDCTFTRTSKSPMSCFWEKWNESDVPSMFLPPAVTSKSAPPPRSVVEPAGVALLMSMPVKADATGASAGLGAGLGVGVGAGVGVGVCWRCSASQARLRHEANSYPWRSEER